MDKLDPEMLKNLDLLVNYEVLDSEKDWDLIEEAEETEAIDSMENEEQKNGQ